MHACKITSPINNMNNYYITFNYLEELGNSVKNNHDINELVNYIRLHYRFNKISYIVEYDNIEYEVIKTVSTTVTTSESTTVTSITTYKLLLNKLNTKLKSLPPNTDCEITVFFKKEIDDPAIMMLK